jgi:acetyltransferase-like isoleucine patch superfamily enzyme
MKKIFDALLKYKLMIFLYIFCYLKGFLYFQKIVYVGLKTRISGIKNITLGSNVKFLYSTKIDATRGHIQIGNNVTLGDKDVVLIAVNSKITIDNGCYISGYTHVAAYSHDIFIGQNTLIGPNSFIVSENHGFKDKNKLIKNQDGTGMQISIGEDVWVGAYTVILPGSKISNGVVLGAQSLVNQKSLTSEYGIFAGSPIRKISERI